MRSASPLGTRGVPYQLPSRVPTVSPPPIPEGVTSEEPEGCTGVKKVAGTVFQEELKE